MSDVRASRADDDRPDLKWVVEWLVQQEGQRKTAALLGVNRKTVALALSRDRLTGRMTLAVQRFMASLDDPDGERTTPLDRLEARIQVSHELAALVESLTERVEALEAAQKPEERDRAQADAPGAEGRRLGLFGRWQRRRPRGEEESDG